MENEVLTFGEYLGLLLKEKNITITKLAELTGTKSRNAIERLLNDSTSIRIIEAFVEKFINVAELQLSPQEIALIEQSVEVSREGKDLFTTRKTLLMAFGKQKAVDSSIHDIKFQNADGNIISQFEYLSENTNYKRIELLAVGEVFTPIIFNFLSFYRDSSSTETCVEHISLFGQEKCKIAAAFVSMYKLLNYDNYKPLYYESEDTILEFAALKKTTVIGGTTTDIVIFFQDRFLLFNDNPGNSLFDFSNILFQKIKTNSKDIKLEFGSNNPMEEIIALSDFHFNMEKSSDEHFIKPNFCTQMIPRGILYRIASEVDYRSLGYDIPDSIVQEAVELYIQRCSNYYSVQNKRIHLFTKRGLLDFVQTGYISDHFVLFRALTKDEIKKTLELNLKQIQANPHFKIMLLKDGFTLTNISINYYKNKYLCLFEESAGYGDSYFDARISAKPIIDIFDDFIENVLMKNYIYPESETVEYLKYLISTLG